MILIRMEGSWFRIISIPISHPPYALLVFFLFDYLLSTFSIPGIVDFTRAQFSNLVLVEELRCDVLLIRNIMWRMLLKCGYAVTVSRHQGFIKPISIPDGNTTSGLLPKKKNVFAFRGYIS